MGRDREAGFTLIEVMISLTIFAIGMLGISSMQLMGLRGNVYTDQYGTATRLGMEMFERINNYALNPANFNNGVFQLPALASQGWNDKIDVLLGADANGATAIAYAQATRLNTVTVTVQWPNNHQVTFTSSIAQ